jgi:diadenosine tetraphosphatase ApaH/serine/threonine PP2A family protein phosphatase
MHILKRVNSYTISLAYMSLVCLILENGAMYWDPCREGQINVLDRVQKKMAKFANHMCDLVWETLVQCRKIAGIYASFKAYIGEQAWQSIWNRLKDHATSAGIIMIIKLGSGNKEQTLLNTVL